MTTFQGFDSFDEMMNALDEAEAAANKRITTPQREHLTLAETEITYWFRLHHDLMIFGKTQPVEAQALREQELGAEDFEYDLERFTDRHQRGFLYGHAYSVIEPDGELGSTHVSEVTQCDANTFEVMAKYGWNLDHLHRKVHPQLARSIVTTMMANWDTTHERLI